MGSKSVIDLGSIRVTPPDEQTRARAILRLQEEPDGELLMEALGLIDTETTVSMALRRSCPQCGAAVGKRCKSVHGQSIGRAHVARR